MALITLPKNPTAKDVLAALVAVEERLAATEARVAENTEAIRAILTLLHPDPQHPDVEEDPALASFHRLVMKWIERYGREEPT